MMKNCDFMDFRGFNGDLKGFNGFNVIEWDIPCGKHTKNIKNY